MKSICVWKNENSNRRSRSLLYLSWSKAWVKFNTKQKSYLQIMQEERTHLKLKAVNVISNVAFKVNTHYHMLAYQQIIWDYPSWKNNHTSNFYNYPQELC